MKRPSKPTVDPTAPDVSVRLKGSDYKLAFTFASLAAAERKLAEVGIPVNIFAALDFSGVPSAAKLGILLYAALQPSHDELSYEDTCALLTMTNAAKAYEAICLAYTASMSEPDEDAEKND